MASVLETFRPRRAWAYTQPRVATEALPVVYGDLSAGSGGLWACPCLDTENFVYAYAGHPVLSAEQGNSITVYDKDDAEIDPGAYSFNPSDNYEGQGAIATLTFSTDQKAQEPLSVRGQGRAAGGVLLENAVDIVEDFLVELAGFEAGDLNPTFFSRARARAEELGLNLAGVMEEDQSVGSVLSEMLFPWGDWWRDREGRLCLRLEAGPGSYSEAEVAGYFPARLTLGAAIEAEAEGVVNQAALEYAYNFRRRRFEAGDDGSATADALSQSVYGVKARKFSLKWVRAAEVAQQIQANLVARFREPSLVFSLSVPGFRSICLERGDVVAVSLSWFYDADGEPLANQLMKVLEVETDFLAGQMSFRLQYLGEELYLTRAWAADGTWRAEGAVTAGAERETTPYE